MQQFRLIFIGTVPGTLSAPLAGLREPDFIDKLPVAESRACRELWKEIDDQIDRVRRQK